MSTTNITTGDYSGAYFNAWNLPADVISSLAGIRAWLQSPEEIPSLGRHALARHTIVLNGAQVPLAIKSFSRATRLKDRYFEKNGSKARRSFLTAVRLAEHGVGTPKPLAYLDRWENGRLLESYYLCVYQDNISSFRDELNRLYLEDPLCRRIMSVMETVAMAIADMHDAGVCHRDLGNQNILLRRVDDDTWSDVQFIDLNRAHIADRLTAEQKARDISRIDLPSDFLRVFKCMYFRHQHPSAEFQKWENHFRKRFALHTATRKYRHPIREARQKKKDELETRIPRGRELWVWDDRSVQAVSTMLRKERHTYYPAINNFYVARGLFKSIAPVYSRYRDLLKICFTREVDLSHRIGMAVGTVPGTIGEELPLLGRVGSLPVLMRFYRHETEVNRNRALEDAARLKQAGHPVFAALVQDRAGIREPHLWEAFVESVLPRLSGVADWLEVGHAVNRVKWGVWRIDEYRALLNPVRRIAQSCGPFKLSGPSVIDFEYHYLAGMLDVIPQDGCLDALSHHLYVDRRGAPENRQGRFSSVEKFALAKAFAGWSKAVKGDRLIVSEVNWPILDTGVYSPVCSPYTIPGSHTNDPSVGEEDYANFMIRYYVLALCSGMVDAVYWWRLVSRGFGLVDDAEFPWRLRPAYVALKHFVAQLGQSVFVEKMPAAEGVWLLRFRNPDGSATVMAWAHPEPVQFNPGFRFDTVLHRDGHEIKHNAERVTLDGCPVYFMDVR